MHIQNLQTVSESLSTTAVPDGNHSNYLGHCCSCQKTSDLSYHSIKNVIEAHLTKPNLQTNCTAITCVSHWHESQMQKLEQNAEARAPRINAKCLECRVNVNWMYRTGVKTLAYQCVKYKCKKNYKQLLIPTCEHHEQNACDLGLNEEGSWYDHQCPNPLVQCEGGIPLQSDQVHHIHSTSSLQHHECGLHPLHLSCEKAPPAIHTCLLWKGWQGRMHISLTCNISNPWHTTGLVSQQVEASK